MVNFREDQNQSMQQIANIWLDRTRYTDSCFTDCVSGKYGYNYESAFCRRDETGTCKICCCEMINE
ncbi:unnamed protein product [Arabidopsis lyrata]|uniref:Uncharacterized protein n=1 Tax=Arabidopsis lyrata subsp. lyrata TaxID=81972 RepID=D7MJB7_ARALL|nr:hypothetical protein ARALYDRAFT_916250 [Arabidopsis lyrata subsp. lyrata]CAH8277616.1 unnamed protein product [Arabidopsis lyrata]